MENYAPVPQKPPPHSFQEHDALLGSSSASPAHSYQHSLQSRRRYHDTINQAPTRTSTSEDEIGSEQNPSDFPSILQQAAVTALQDYDNETIFAWLTGLRSFNLGGENWFQPGCLSPQQLEAVSALKDCTNSLILAWLDSVRYGDQYPFLCQTNNQYSNAKAQEVSMPFTVTMVTATSLSREPP